MISLIMIVPIGMQNEPYAPESIHGHMLVHRIKVQGTCTVAK